MHPYNNRKGPVALLPLVFVLVLAAAASGLRAANDRTLHVATSALPAISADLQFRMIADAAQAVQPGDTVVVHSGIYRERVVIDRSGTPERPIRFEVAPAAHVIVTGADRLVEWKQEDAPAGENVFSASWPHRFITWSRTGTHPSNDYHKLIGRAEQVFINDYPLQQVLRREQVGRGTFFADLENHRLYVQSSDNAIDKGKDPMRKNRVEASVRATMWEVKGDHVVTRGFRFRYAANQAQTAGALFRGRGDVIEDCVFERMNSEGASFLGSNQVVRRCVFQENGEFGWTANHAHDLVMTDSVTARNNTKNFMRDWAAGGVKVVFTRGMVIDRCRFEENRGVGLWFDIDNRRNTVSHCLIADNEDAGIFYEISSGLHAHDNVIIGNGFAGTPGAWGGNGGIALSSSPECVIERNLLVGNREGFQFREQIRTTPLQDRNRGDKEVPTWNHDEIIRCNVIAYNQDAQTWGWFDTRDERHWPAAMQQQRRETGYAQDDIAAPYGARNTNGQPTGLTLEKLRLSFQTNIYATADLQGLFNWGTAWQRHSNFVSLDSVRQQLALEQGSMVAPIVFADGRARDFRVAMDSPAVKADAYPRGEVPGVRLGVLP